MAKLIWGDVGRRFYEAGVDRGVLFIDSFGYPWNGLTAVSEAPSGGTPTPLYLDGIKYLNLTSAEEYEATINAISSPPEFNVCDGSSTLYMGLSITQQPRKSFSFSYRTKLGNDVDGLDHGYKIHLVYNAMAAPSSQNNASLSATAAPVIFSWKVTTIPVISMGYKPSAHYVIDTSKVPAELIIAIEDILYGTGASPARLPVPEELFALFEPYGPLVIKSLPNGAYSATGHQVLIATPASFTIDDSAVMDNGDGSFTITY